MEFAAFLKCCHEGTPGDKSRSRASYYKPNRALAQNTAYPSLLADAGP
jgi:hypothetical protein